MSDKLKDGGPAFPNEYSSGMSLRDYFAAKAISEMKWREFYDDENLDIPAKACYEVADAMLEAREK